MVVIVAIVAVWRRSGIDTVVIVAVRPLVGRQLAIASVEFVAQPLHLIILLTELIPYLV